MNSDQFIKTKTAIGVQRIKKVAPIKQRVVKLGNPTLADCPVIVSPSDAAQKGMMYVYSDADGTINVEQALNDGKVTTWSNDQRHLEVIVGYPPPGFNVLTILGLAPTAFEQTGGASPQQMAQIAAQNITPDKLQQLRLVPQATPDLTCRLTAGLWVQNNTIIPVAEIEAIDFTASVPGFAGQAVYVHVAVDNTGAAVLTDGVAFDSAAETSTVENLPTTFDAGNYSIGWVRLEYGQTTIEQEHIISALGINFGLGVVSPEFGGMGFDLTGTQGVLFHDSVAGAFVMRWNTGNSDPDVNYDTAHGYYALSIVENSLTGAVFICTNSANGAAQWDQINTGGTGSMSSFTLAGDSGSSQTISDGNTLTIAGGTGLSSVASATDTVTLNLDNTAVSPGSYTHASITVDAQGRLTAASSGTTPVTSVGLSLPAQFSISGSPVTTTGTLTASWASQTANTVLAAPDGSSGTPTFRALVAADIPSLDASKITSGTLNNARVNWAAPGTIGSTTPTTGAFTTITGTQASITGTTPSSNAALTINAAVSHLYAIDIDPDISTSTNASRIARFRAEITLGATITDLYGINVFPIVSGSNSYGVTNFNVVYAQPFTDASYTGTITSAVGFRYNDFSRGNVSAVVTNQYGVYVASLTTATNNWAIYTNTGAVRIGDTFDHDGSTFGVLGATPATQQTGGAATAGATWTATEQSMLNKAYGALRTFGFLS